MKRGLFITVEGGEGVGKTTFIQHLASWFQKNDLPYYLSREPGGTPVGEKIRELVLMKAKLVIGPKAELLLFLSSRAEHVDKIIEPNLQKGVTVICDRFTDSSIAYQGYGRESNVEEISRLCFEAIPLVPDITFFLDLSPDEGFKRVYKRSRNKKDRLESEKIQFHERVRQGYLALAKRFPKRYLVIDASKSVDEVASLGIKAIERHLHAS
jgi:dTMP kinase